VLVARVIGSKQSREGGRRWLLVDAGMNDLIRPALYTAKHRIEPLSGAAAASPSGGEALPWRVVGPVCESSDDFGEHPFAAIPDHVIIRDAGAYGFTMASEYNGRGLPTEVFLRGGRVVAVSTPRDAAAWAAARAAIAET
jgi:diaminopimelate decarboxylase